VYLGLREFFTFEMSEVTHHDNRVPVSENGWADDFIGHQWFEKTFIPQATQRNRSGKRILLIYDGHVSHTTLEMVKIARENRIDLFCLPPHTTHRLQPLDVGVFSPLQTAWSDRCAAVLEETGFPMEIYEVVGEYTKARTKSFKAETIRQAWNKAGFNPERTDTFKEPDITPGIFKEADFAPSYSPPYPPRAPASFLSRMPRAPDASPDDLFNMEVLYNDDESDDSDDSNFGKRSRQG
jgi:hypothetical protein